MKLAVENNALRWNYVETILRNWANKKFKSLADVEADRLRFEAARNQKSQKKNSPPKEVIPDWLYKQKAEQSRTQQAETKTKESSENFEARRKRILEALGDGEDSYHEEMV